MTGLFLACYNVGSALGDAIAGAIWSQVLPGELSTRIGNAAIAGNAYGDPYTFAASYAMNTSERQGAVEAYKYVQRLLCIAGICLTVPLIAFALCMRNPKLNEEQSFADAEERKESS